MYIYIHIYMKGLAKNVVCNADIWKNTSLVKSGKISREQ